MVNFDVPNSPEDYVHRAGRTARADMKGDAFLFVSPDEEQDAARIERAIGKRIPRVIVPGFDYSSRPKEALEIPLGQRLAAMRAQRSAGHARRNAGARRPPVRRAGHPGRSHRPARGPHGRPARSGQGYGGGGGGGRRARAADRAGRESGRATPGRQAAGEQLLQRGQVDRLRQVVVEARLRRAAPVLLLAPAGHRDQHHPVAPAASRMRRATS